MIYEEHFSPDWESLTRDEAMVQAFVIGIDAVKGDDHPGELDRLRDANNTAYVEMAYDAGRQKCQNSQEETSAAEDVDAELPVSLPSEVVSELVSSGPDQSDTETARSDRSQVDLPAMLEDLAFLDSRPDNRARGELPEFLQE